MSGQQLPAIADLTAYRGDTWSQNFRFAKGDVPEDLSTATLAAEARDQNNVKFQLQVEGDSQGNCAIAQPPGGLAVGSYEYDVQVTSGGVVTTWVRGVLVIQQDVTT